MLTLFAKGFALGLAIAAPVGPIGLLCIRRTLADGPALGFATGLGAATADAAYGAVAGFGLAAVADAMMAGRTWLAALGGIVLLWLGWRTATAAPAARAADGGGARSLVVAWSTTVLLTLTNPATILSFAAAFAALGLGEWAGDHGASLVLVLGVFLGSAAWWLGLSLAVARLRARIGPAALAWINRLGGGALVLFGLIAIYAALV
ncbi:LysE family translocator [Stella sp.]|uniref:LysE family translocator n=1 Tax=Stella sp. TaxID=2912054 RepID=UPI0035B10BED